VTSRPKWEAQLACIGLLVNFLRLLQKSPSLLGPFLFFHESFSNGMLAPHGNENDGYDERDDQKL